MLSRAHVSTGICPLQEYGEFLQFPSNWYLARVLVFFITWGLMDREMASSYRLILNCIGEPLYGRDMLFLA